MDKQFEKLFDDMIERYDLQGRSFTWGVALYMAMREGWLDDDMQSALDYEVEVYIGDVLDEVGDRLNLRYNYRGLAEVIDLAVLDAIAKELIREDEEE